MFEVKRQQFKNAWAIIQQIRRGEWEFGGHYPYDFDAEFKCYTATRNGVELWVGNGSYACGIRDKPWELGSFGWFVWHLAAKKEARALEKRKRRRPTDLTKTA